MSGEKHESLPNGRVALAKMLSLEWMMAHAKPLFFSVCTVALLSACLFSLKRHFSGGSRLDYLKAEAAFSKWVSSEKHDQALFKQISDPLVHHPELGSKFGALIAQRLLSLGETNLAYTYAQAALKRTKALLSPYHARFSQNTLLISQEKWQEALDASYQLKQEMASDTRVWGEEKQTRVGRTLYAYNLLRIASLEREIGSKEKEIAAWDEVLHSAGWEEPHSKTYDPEVFRQLAENFKSGDVSLVDYIQQRKKELAKSSSLS